MDNLFQPGGLFEDYSYDTYRIPYGAQYPPPGFTLVQDSVRYVRFSQAPIIVGQVSPYGHGQPYI